MNYSQLLKIKDGGGEQVLATALQENPLDRKIYAAKKFKTETLLRAGATLPPK